MEYLNHKHAAIQLDINEKTLTKLVAENQIPFSKKGREKLYLKSDIEKLADIDLPSEVQRKIIMIHSGKGGTGKTTIANYLSNILSKEGKSVLVADADPQHYFSRFWGTHLSDEDKKKIDSHNLLSLLEGNKKLVRCALPVNDKFHFIAGNRKLEHYDSLFANSYGRELKLQKALAPALAKYDYIFIDSSPSQGGVTVPALFACHMLICPIDPEIDSLDSAIELTRTIEKIKQSDMSSFFQLSKLYILPIKQKEGMLGSKFAKEVLKEIKASFGDDNYNLDIEVLDPILNYESVPVERWQGIFNTDTKAYKNFYNSFKGVFNLNG